MLEFTCSKCHYPVSLDTSVCPKCGAILNGIRCSSCLHVDTETAFRNNGNRCPNCNNLHSLTSGNLGSSYRSYGSSSYISTPFSQDKKEKAEEPSIPPKPIEIIGIFILGTLCFGLGIGGLYMVYSLIKQYGLDLIEIVFGGIIGCLSLVLLFGACVCYSFIIPGLKGLRESKKKENS